MIQLKNIVKSFKSRTTDTHAVDGVTLNINDGEIFGIIGFSGAGKSTLVRCINLLERPDSGEVIIDGVNLCELSKKDLSEARKKIGMIFQQFNLLEQRTVAKNVRYPLEISGASKADADKRVAELLDIVGLTDKAESYPSQLSGGQKQRVAIARALATNPNIILCDEATSALDPITTSSVLDLLKKLNKELGVTIVVITHEMAVVERICDRVAVINAGKIEEEGSVHDVFLRPQSETAKKLIAPRKNDEIFEKFPEAIRLAFDGTATEKPVVAGLIKECNCDVNILNANVTDISGKLFGQMIIDIQGDDTSRDRAYKFLNDNNIIYETRSVK